MRISDWSSDVCSSDLHGFFGGPLLQENTPIRIHKRNGDDVEERGMRAIWSRNIVHKYLLTSPFWKALISCCFIGRFSLFCFGFPVPDLFRSEEQTSELQSLMRISYAVFCLNKKK